ncbi:MAG: pseudaminic acid synthase [Bacteroidetes bacterium]|nr:pseudaminic acid synthase [Bacteroidota bacterium]
MNFLSNTNTKYPGAPFIIAEMSGNHNQSLERALQIVDAAAACGVNALKLQTYTADTMTLKGAYVIDDPKSLWYGKELHDLYKEAYTPWEWHKAIFDRAHEKGILCFSSPFDESAVDFLESLNCPIYKIASFENTDHPLLIKVAKTGKPIIMSTGVARLEDILESVGILRANGAKDITLLKCTSTYPSTPENTNLLTIPMFQQVFNCTVGLSDHTMGIGASVAAVALGAKVIEKHFCLSRAEGGVDSAFSLEPEELKSLVVECERAYLALGTVQFGIQEAEKKNVFYKRSIYVSEDIKAGEAITEQNTRIVRPGNGIEPKYYAELKNKKVIKDIKKGSPLTWEYIF